MSALINTSITNREQEILENISMGFTVNEIAKQLFLSPHTIITHRRSLLLKLDAKNGAELVRKGMEAGYLHLNVRYGVQKTA